MSALSIAGRQDAAVAREVALRGALGHLEREFGKGTLMRMGDPGAQVRCEAIPTGALSLDLALGIGGVPRGRIVEVYGPESSGKTTLVYHVLAEDALPFAIAAYATARSQEIRSLTWPAIDWQQCLLTLAEDPNYAKTDAAYRSFPLIPQLKQLLQQEWQRQGKPAGQALVCPGHKPGGANSGMLSISALYTRADKAWKQAKLEPIRLHECRHTAASWLRAAGIDLKLRSILMGHATTATTDGGRGSITDDRYTHLMPGEIEQAGKTLAAYLRKQTK